MHKTLSTTRSGAVTRWVLLTGLSLALVGASACRKPSTPARRDATLPLTPQLPGLAPQKLVIGLTPSLDIKVMRRTFSPVAQYLSTRLGIPVTLRIAKSYNHLLELIGSGEVDLVQLPAYTFIKARFQNPRLRPLVRQIHDGSESYVGYIVTLKERQFHSLKALKGASLGLIDPNSTSGYLLPLLLFHERGINPALFFKSFVFMGNHTKALRMLLARRVDAVAVDSLSLSTAQDTKINPNLLQILAKTRRIPYECWCLTAQHSAGFAERLKAIFLELNTRTAAGRKILGRMLKVNGFVPAADEDYMHVIKAHQLLKSTPLIKVQWLDKPQK